MYLLLCANASSRLWAKIMATVGEKSLKIILPYLFMCTLVLLQTLCHKFTNFMFNGKNGRQKNS